jgi:hypothetical protein
LCRSLWWRWSLSWSTGISVEGRAVIGNGSISQVRSEDKMATKLQNGDIIVLSFLCPLPSLWYQPSDSTCFTFLSFIYEKKKKRYFCFFKIAIQGISL